MSRVGRDWADRQCALPRKAQVLAWHLGYFADDDGHCWINQSKLVQRTGWAKGTIKRWTDLLRALDLVGTKRRFNPRKRHHDALSYRLNLGRVVTADEVQSAIAILRSHSAEPDRKNGVSRIATGGTLMKNTMKDGAAAGRGRIAHATETGRDAPPTELKSEISVVAARDPSPEPQAAPARALNGGREGMTPPIPPASGGAQPLAGARHGPEADQGHELRAARAPTLRRMQVPVETPLADREAKAAEYVMLAKVEAWRQTGKWDRADGPPPFAEGCTVPAELLPQRIRLARKDPAPPPGRTAGEVVERLVDAFARRAA